MAQAGNGDQGRTSSPGANLDMRSMPAGRGPRMARVHRTNDTRIFSRSGSRVRREQGEEGEQDFVAPTEPNSPTEPIPNPGGRRRPSRAVSSRNARASAHRDRALSEPGPSWARRQSAARTIEPSTRRSPIGPPRRAARPRRASLGAWNSDEPRRVTGASGSAARFSPPRRVRSSLVRDYARRNNS